MAGYNYSRSKKKRNKKLRSIFVSLLVIALCGAAGYYLWLNPAKADGLSGSLAHADQKEELGSLPIVEPTIKYGFAIDTFQLTEGTIERNMFLADLLLEHGVDYVTISKLAENAEDVFSVRNLRPGQKYTILSQEPGSADYFIYEPSVYDYVVFDLKRDLSVVRHERPVETRVETGSGVVTSSLWDAMVDNGLSWDITAKMEDALQWSVDFHHIQKGDAFQLVFDRHYIEGEPVGVGQLHVAYYNTSGNDYHAVYFEDEKFPGYYDLEGRPMKSTFLKSPVKYSRISSRYNLNRYHPILKRRRPHYGTDYAAAYGTPIVAVANGVITTAGYTRGNGNYVKIRHKRPYETQYLHMQRFAKGIRSGVQVKQGQVIGYVGSTGLATGPHVCFRFWKNGRQVNHLALSFPPPEPLPDDKLPEFFTVRDEMMELLNTVETPQPALPKAQTVAVAQDELAEDLGADD